MGEPGGSGISCDSYSQRNIALSLSTPLAAAGEGRGGDSSTSVCPLRDTPLAEDSTRPGRAGPGRG